MAKKKSKKTPLLPFISAMFALLASLLIFTPVLSAENTSFSGIEIAFGKEIANLFGIAKGNIPFNALALIAFIMPLSAAALLILFKNKIAAPLAALFALVSVVLLLTMPNYVDVQITIFNQTTLREMDWAMQWGLVSAAVLSALSLVISSYQTYKSFR